MEEKKPTHREEKPVKIRIDPLVRRDDHPEFIRAEVFREPVREEGTGSSQEGGAGSTQGQAGSGEGGAGSPQGQVVSGGGTEDLGSNE